MTQGELTMTQNYTTHEYTAMKLLWEGHIVGLKRAHITALILATAHKHKDTGFTVHDLITTHKENPHYPIITNPPNSKQLSKINPVTRQALNDLRTLGLIHKTKHHYHITQQQEEQEGETNESH